MTSERGSVTIVVLTMVVLLMVLAAGLGSQAAVESARLRAQTAADAAALAAAPLTFRSTAETSRMEAARIAAMNGARLIACLGCVEDPSWNPRVVEVAVEVAAATPLLGSKGVTAVAAAEFAPTLLLDLP